jgi:hypothetical protein
MVGLYIISKAKKRLSKVFGGVGTFFQKGPDPPGAKVAIDFLRKLIYDP